MQAYMFQSTRDQTVNAFSADRGGSRLPTQLGPWRAVGGGIAVSLGEPNTAIIEALRGDGFYLLTSDDGERL